MLARRIITHVTNDAVPLSTSTGNYIANSYYIQVLHGDAVALLLGHLTCDLQVADSIPGWAPLRSGLGQATYTCVPLTPSSTRTGQGDELFGWESKRRPHGK